MTKTINPPPPTSASASTSSPKEFWESFLGTSVSFTAYEIALYSRLNLDSFALELAKVLCTRLSIPSKTGKILVEAVDKSLNIGDDIQKAHRNLTGLQKIIGKLSSTVSGLRVLAVVGVICEYYTDEAVVPIFNELTKFYQLPVDLRPSAEKCQSLTQLSAGFAEVHDFGSLVEKFTKLGQAEESELRHIGGGDVAGLLYGMGELTRGDQTALVCFMGRDAGWVAAVAEWLFDLKIVLKGQDHTVLYTNCEEEEVQFDIRFQKPGVPCDGSPPMVHDPLKVKEKV